MLFALVSSCAHEKKDSGQCSTLGECLKLSSSLTGNSYLFDEMKLNEKVGSIGKVTWDKENADLLIGELLASAGYYRLDMGKKVYKLINAIDVRYTAGIKSFSATKETNDPLPTANAADPVELVYHSKNGPQRPSEIARNLRPFMSRYGRVIDERSGGLIIVRDTASNLHQLLPLIRRLDTPFTAQEIKVMKNSNKFEELGSKIQSEVSKRISEMLEKAKQENPPGKKP